MSFPIINNISDVLPHIEGKDEFYVNHKNGYDVIDYRVNLTNTFPEIFGEDLTEDELNHRKILRECRGIIFEQGSGKIIRRMWHKFFNAGKEKREGFLENIDISKKHHITMKIDGSCVAPFIVNNTMIWGSMAGETFITELVLHFFDKSGLEDDYVNFANRMINQGFTPIFEFVSPENRIVINYPEPNLILTGIRNMVSGEYVPYDDLKNMVNDEHIPIVKLVTKNLNNLEKFIEDTRGIIGEEGYVLEIENDLRVKIKLTNYLLKHRTKDEIQYEKNLIPLIVNKSMDDMYSILDDDTVEKIKMFSDQIMSNILQVSEYIDKTAKYCQEHFKTKKDIALYIQANVSQRFQSLIFSEISSQQNSLELVKAYILKHCTSQTNVDNMREFIGSRTWSEIYQVVHEDN